MVAVASTTSFLVSAAAVVWQLLSSAPQGRVSCDVNFPEPAQQELVCVCAQEVRCQYPSPGPVVGHEDSGSFSSVVAAASGGFSIGLLVGLCICCKLNARRADFEAPVSLIRDGGDRQRRSTALAVPY